MITAEHTEGVEPTVVASAGALTDAEVQSLTMFQQRCGYQPLFLELGMDIRRLEFARWLVQRGILNEGIGIACEDSATGADCELRAVS